MTVYVVCIIYQNGKTEIDGIYHAYDRAVDRQFEICWSADENEIAGVSIAESEIKDEPD